MKRKKIKFCITSYGSDSKKNFYKNIKKTLNENFTEKDLLASLTTIPAKFIKEEKNLGSLEKGKIATLFISSGDALDVKSNNVTCGIINGEFIRD